MKKITVIAALMLLSASAFGQKANIKWPDYEFTTEVQNVITSVKDQHRSGTCWAFSTLGFVESEIIRINGIKDEAAYPDFSEMFVIYRSYLERADKYVRLDGALNFAAGSESDDVLHIIKDYGLMPQSVYSGMNYGTELPVQGEMDAALKSYVEAIVRNPNRKLTPVWKNGVDGILKAYLGEIPETFTVDGVSYTPASYRDHFKFNPEDYVSLTSFTHHPFYTYFAIEVNDNWRWDTAYNIPIDEFMKVLDSAIRAGYTVAWGADVSEPGFTRDGIGVLLDPNAVIKQGGSDQEKWVGKEEGKPAPVPAPAEIVPDQEYRQKAFDNKTLTDDHGMQIFGIAHDQFGTKYYMVKNSWGTKSKYKGIWYVTENYVKGMSLDIMLHKDALPKDLKKKIAK
ncbi:MAG: aminopeptidase [Bacteroidales bacterium]|nr:aminopeptidase [Bacteroidales bacterium]